MQTDINALSGIRTHDPSVWEGEDGSCLTPRGHYDRLCYSFQSIKWLNTSSEMSQYVGYTASVILATIIEMREMRCVSRSGPFHYLRDIFLRVTSVTHNACHKKETDITFHNLVVDKFIFSFWEEVNICWNWIRNKRCLLSFREDIRM
jgi:hypothetical protein